MHDEMTITLKASIVRFLFLCTQFPLCRYISATRKSFTETGTLNIVQRVTPARIPIISSGHPFGRHVLNETSVTENV